MILSSYLIFNAIMFGVTILGILFNRNNLLSLLIYIKLMLLVINSNFIIYSKLWNDVHGQIWILFILSISMVKFLLILIILLKFFMFTKDIKIEQNNKTKNLRTI